MRTDIRQPKQKCHDSQCRPGGLGHGRAAAGRVQPVGGQSRDILAVDDAVAP